MTDETKQRITWKLDGRVLVGTLGKQEFIIRPSPGRYMPGYTLHIGRVGRSPVMVAQDIPTRQEAKDIAQSYVEPYSERVQLIAGLILAGLLLNCFVGWLE